MLQSVTGGSELEEEVTEPFAAEDEVTPFLVFFLKKTMKVQFLQFDFETA